MKKKTLTIAIALVLVVALAVGATYALLAHSTDEVVNTFAVGKIKDDGTVFSLKEHAIAGQEATCKYILKTGDDASDYTTSNAYNAVVPGVDLPKDPTVKVEKLAGDAYLYVVVDNQLTGGLTYSVDGKWTEIGSNGSKKQHKCRMFAQKYYSLSIILAHSTHSSVCSLIRRIMVSL